MTKELAKWRSEYTKYTEALELETKYDPPNYALRLPSQPPSVWC